MYKLNFQNEKQFMGRTEIINNFWCIYNNFKDSNFKVINYHGMTGIGKTSLINRLIGEFDQKDKNGFYIKLDMDYCLRRDVENEYISQTEEEILLKIRNKLIDKYKFKFNLFDQVLYQYYKEIGIPKEQPEVQMLIEKNSTLNNALDIISDFVVPISVVLDIAKALNIGYNFLNNKLNKEKSLSELTDKQLYQMLPLCFASDLQKNTENLSSPLVIFIDTYEMLFESLSKIGVSYFNDKWLRDSQGIIQNTTNILWVISGRQKLNWEEIANNQISVQINELKMLDKEISTEFLKVSGIKEEKLCNEIYQKGEGIPLYLSLCIDQYILLTSQGITPQIDDFTKNLDSLSNNIIRYMDVNDQEILYYLACLENWNDDFIIEIGSKFMTCFSYLRYNNIKNLSFIEKNENGYYTIKKIARELLFNSCDINIKKIVQKNLNEYYSTLLSNPNLSIPDEINSLIGYINCSIIHEEDDKKAFEMFLSVKEHFFSLAKKFQVEQATKILNRVYLRFKGNKNLYPSITNIYIRFLINNGDYNLLYDVCSEFYDLYKNEPINSKYYSFGYLESKKNLASALSFQGKDKAALQLSEEVYQEKLNFYKISDIEILRNIAYSYSKLGNNFKAIELYKQIMNIEQENNLDTTRTQKSIINSYSYLGKYKEAIEMYDKLIAQCEQSPDKTLQILSLKNNQSMVYCHIGDTKKALKILQTVLEGRKKFYREDHPEILNTITNIAIAQCLNGEYEKSIENYNYVYSKRIDALGEMHKSTIDALNGLAMAYYYEGNLEIAEQLLIDSYNKRTNSYDKDDLKIAETLHNLSKLYIKKNDAGSAMQYAILSYNIRLNKLGDNHILTLDTLATIGIIYITFGEKEKGINLLKDILPKAQNIVCENHHIIRDITNALTQKDC